MGVASVAGFAVGYVATFGVGSVAGSAALSGAGSRAKVSFEFFIGNNLLLKLLRTFFLALNNNPKLFKRDFFQVFLYLHLFNSKITLHKISIF